MTKEERAKAFADRHQEAELQLRGLGATYGYQRIYNAEICAYERGATEQEKIDEEEQGKALLYAVHKTTERTKKEMIDKACEWLWENIGHYVNEQGFVETHELDKDFRKALEK